VRAESEERREVVDPMLALCAGDAFDRGAKRYQDQATRYLDAARNFIRRAGSAEADAVM
jgi:hypothetical protein